MAEAARGGVGAVQLREKDLDEGALYDEAMTLRAVLGTTPLLVNGAVEVARAVGAAGVHLPETTGSVAATRAALGPQALVGRLGPRHNGRATGRCGGDRLLDRRDDLRDGEQTRSCTGWPGTWCARSRRRYRCRSSRSGASTRRMRRRRSRRARGGSPSCLAPSAATDPAEAVPTFARGDRGSVGPLVGSLPSSPAACGWH